MAFEDLQRHVGPPPARTSELNSLDTMSLQRADTRPAPTKTMAENILRRDNS